MQLLQNTIARVFDPVSVTGEKGTLLVHGIAKGSIKVTVRYREKDIHGLWFGVYGINATSIHKQVLKLQRHVRRTKEVCRRKMGPFPSEQVE